MAAEARNLYFSAMSRRAPTRADNLRSAVAEEAARLMAEHGIQDFRIAKKKAAERYGVVDGSVLPGPTSRGPHVTIAMIGHRAAEFVV